MEGQGRRTKNYWVMIDELIIKWVTIKALSARSALEVLKDAGEYDTEVILEAAETHRAMIDAFISDLKSLR